MAPPLSPSVLLGQARATFERLRTPNAGLPRTENPLRDSLSVVVCGRNDAWPRHSRTCPCGALGALRTRYE